MYEDDDLNLDNLEEELQDDLEDEQDDSDADEEGEDDSEPTNRGNLSKALQAERREKRELKENYSRLEQELQKQSALLERLGQGQQQKQDPEQNRMQLQAWMLERPDEFVGTLEQRMEQRFNQSLRQNMAPLLVSQTERVVASNPKHLESYNIPEIRSIVDNFVENEVQNGGILNQNDLKEVVGRVMDAVQVIRGTTGVSKDPNRQKMTSVAQKGASSGRKSSEQRVQELQNLARTNPRKYVEEMKKPENRQAVNEIAFKRKPT